MADQALCQRLARNAADTIAKHDLTWVGNARRVTVLAERLAQGVVKA